MFDFTKVIPRNLRVVIFLTTVVLLILAIIGTIPTGSGKDSRIELSAVQRGYFVGLAAVAAVAFVGSTVAEGFASVRRRDRPPLSEEHRQKFNDTQNRLSKISSEETKYAERDFNGSLLVIVSGNIVDATTQVIVSSDDNYLSAEGGVAKAIVKRAGSSVEGELENRRQFIPRPKHGDIAITSGGMTSARAIFHPVMIDFDHYRYPEQDLVRRVVKKCLVCAEAIGADSIAFPVLGGGTAAKNISPWESIAAIVTELRSYLERPELRGDRLTELVLYIFDSRDMEGDVEALLNES